MNDFTIAICCFVDDYLQIVGQKTAAKRNDVEVITTSAGLPVEYLIVAGSMHSACTKYELEEMYQECGQVALLPQCKSNSRRKESPAMAFVKQTMRKWVETCLSGIENDFPKAFHDVTPQGFLLKIVLFLFAYAIDKRL